MKFPLLTIILFAFTLNTIAQENSKQGIKI